MPDFLYEHRVTVFVLIGIFLSLLLFRIIMGEIRRATGGNRQQQGLSLIRYLTSRHPILLLSLVSLVILLIVVMGLISSAIPTPQESVFSPAVGSQLHAILFRVVSI